MKSRRTGTIAPGLVFGVAQFFALIAILLFFGGQAAMAADLAGHITRLKGSGTVTSGEETRAAAVGVEVHVGDVVKTGAATRIELILLDESAVTLGDNTVLTIDRFVYAADTAMGAGFLRLTEGVFRAFSGGLSKRGDGAFQVETPVAIVGTRGTEFWGELKADGLLIALLGGMGVFVQNEAGRIDIVTSGMATQVVSATQAPSEPFQLTEEQLNAALATVAW